ncbi:MAG: DUF2341 domain-containing protein, partial [Thermoplasmata archaeon]
MSGWALRALSSVSVAAAIIISSIGGWTEPAPSDAACTWNSGISLSSENAPWWNSGWLYRRAIVINNAAVPEALKAYQVFLKVAYDSDMKPDFSDLRFIQYKKASNESIELPYYIEEKTDGSFAGVWVKVNEIPAASSVVIHMYYGNPSAASVSSPAATFDFYDDFSTDPSGRWSAVSGSASWDPTNQWYSITSTGGSDTAAYRAIAVSMAPIENVEVLLKVYMDSSSSTHDAGPLGRMIDNSNGYGIRIQADDYFALRRLDAGSSMHIGYVTKTIDTRTWYWVKLQVFGSTIRGRVWKVGTQEPDVWDNSVQDSKHTGPGKIGVVQDRGGPSRFDDVRARKYVSPEPTASIGAEELQIQLKSFSLSAEALSERETLRITAILGNPSGMELRIPIAIRDGPEPDTGPFIFSDDVILNASGDTIVSVDWVATGGSHKFWLLVAGSPLASKSVYVNRYPVLSPIMDQVASQGKNFRLLIFAEDADGDRLNWSEDCPLFDIIPRGDQSAEINFTP